MKKYLHVAIIALCILNIILPHSGIAQGTSRVDVGKSFANISKLSTGGTFNPGDTIEIRVTIAVIKQGTYTAIDSVQVFDQVPAKTSYIPGSLRIATNQGVTYKGPFTEAVDADQGSHVAGAITINLGNKANGTRGGRIRSDTSKPSFFNAHCIMMACYRVRINPSTAYGDTIFISGSTKYKMVTPANGWSNIIFPLYKILLFKNNGYCSNGKGISAASDSAGTFGSGVVQNRAAPLAFATTYVKQNVTTGTPNDYYYAIVNNSSPDGSINPALPMPESPAQHRVFGYWDIMGDHTGATNPALGNPPTLPGKRGGNFVMVNASYNTDVAYQETLSGLCPKTNYEFSAWFRNICPRCSSDSNGKGSGSTGFIPYPGNDSSGVRPNLSFEIDGLIYYTTGDIKYDRSSPWKQFGFTFQTRTTQSTANFVIRNNSPGGGGNDWAIDDINIAHCGPSLNMNYNPVVLGCSSNPFVVNLSDTVRYVYDNSYIYFKWQKSNVGGSIWTDMTGPGTSGTGSTTYINGYYQFVTNLPSFLAYPADSGTYYRVIVATSVTNLANNCAFNDGSATMIKVINCSVILGSDFTQFNGKLVQQKAMLTWSTGAEQQVDAYEIEKSDDAVTFYRVARVPAKNIPGSYYNYTDPVAVEQAAYYRIKMTSENGTYKYSRQLLLTNQAGFGINPINNPFKDFIRLEGYMPFEGGQLGITVFNDKGQALKKWQQAVRKRGQIEINIPTTDLPAGIYFMNITHLHESRNIKLIKAVD